MGEIATGNFRTEKYKEAVLGKYKDTHVLCAWSIMRMAPKHCCKICKIVLVLVCEHDLCATQSIYDI